MKSLTPFVFCVVVHFVQSISFNSSIHSPCQLQPRFGLWNLQRGGSKPSINAADCTDDYDRAEKAILKSVENIEAMVEKVVAQEVDILFPKDRPENEIITSSARKAVTRVVDKVKTSIKGHTAKSKYPFEMKLYEQKRTSKDHRDHRVLHAIEAAERAVLQAIINEVDTLFHETVHDKENTTLKKSTAEQAKTTMKDSILKASTVVDNMHSHRRDWLLNVSASMIEDYSLPNFFLE